MISLLEYELIDEKVNKDATLADKFARGQSTEGLTPNERLVHAQEVLAPLKLKPKDFLEYLAIRPKMGCWYTVPNYADYRAHLGLPIRTGKLRPIAQPDILPTTYEELLLRWPVEYSRVSAAAAKLSYYTCSIPLLICYAVYEALETGDLIEYVDGVLFTSDDPTMRLLVNAVWVNLKITRGEWFQEDGHLKPNVIRSATTVPIFNTDSSERIAYDEEQEDKQRRRDVSTKSATIRAVRENAETCAKRAAFFQAVYSDSQLHEALKSFIADVSVSYEALKEQTKDLDSVWETIAQSLPLGTPASKAFLLDFILAGVPKKFTELRKDGSYEIRKPAREPYDKTVRHLDKLFDKLNNKFGYVALENGLTRLRQLITDRGAVEDKKVGKAQ
jgi:hypothetical protein